jgi:ABC-type phosphate/phosphonate transport system substrate-binding protein
MTTRREFLAASAAVTTSTLWAADAQVPLTLIVTDPLAKDNSCPCVAGYGQRDYEQLRKYLAAALGREVAVHFAENLAIALEKKTAGRADIIIGKDSVTRAHAKTAKRDVTHLAALTGLDGETTQTGLFVLPATDAALSIDQLKDKGYRYLFGPAAAEEKHIAAKLVLKDLGISYIIEKEDTATCTACATQLVEHGKAGEKYCGIISSYAMPLLEGCGTIKKGDLKVIGKTDPVPFIAAFATAAVPADVQAKIKAALLAVAKDAALCKAIETKAGFVELPKPGAQKK